MCGELNKREGVNCAGRFYSSQTNYKVVKHNFTSHLVAVFRALLKSEFVIRSTFECCVLSKQHNIQFI